MNRFLSNSIKTIFLFVVFIFHVHADVIPKRIAHAGGGLGHLTYTDSINALNANANLFDLFEIDFNLTSDNQIVCIHDWEHSVTRTFGYKLKYIPSFDEFNVRASNNNSYTNCNILTLIDWMRSNANKYIVTDVKDNNLGVLKKIAVEYPDMVDYIIPQIYHPNEYKYVQDLGFKNVIFTIYGYNGSDAEIIDFVHANPLYALTIPRSRVEGFLRRSSRLNCRFTHIQ